jgi:hypothetical protein
MMDRPLHRRIHLSWLSQEVGPPLWSRAGITIDLEAEEVAALPAPEAPEQSKE